MILCTLGASLLYNLLTGKGITRAGEGAIRLGQDFWFLFILWNRKFWNRNVLSKRTSMAYSRSD